MCITYASQPSIYRPELFLIQVEQILSKLMPRQRKMKNRTLRDKHFH